MGPIWKAVALRRRRGGLLKPKRGGGSAEKERAQPKPGWVVKMSMFGGPPRKSRGSGRVGYIKVRQHHTFCLSPCPYLTLDLFGGKVCGDPVELKHPNWIAAAELRDPNYWADTLVYTITECESTLGHTSTSTGSLTCTGTSSTLLRSTMAVCKRTGATFRGSAHPVFLSRAGGQHHCMLQQEIGVTYTYTPVHVHCGGNSRYAANMRW